MTVVRLTNRVFDELKERKGNHMATKLTHEQAQLHLQVYDLRRETKLREARDWFQQNYKAETYEEAMRSPRALSMVITLAW